MFGGSGGQTRNIAIGLFLSGLIVFGNNDYFYRSGNLDAYLGNRFYFENVSRSASPAIVQKAQFEKTAVGPWTHSLQVDDRRPVPTSSSALRDLSAGHRGNAALHQWAGAISAGVVAVIASLLLMVASGARFNWF